MKPIVALDFDGVICDSIDECMLVAHNAYCIFRGRGVSADRVEDLTGDYVAHFRRRRHLVQPAEAFWMLVHLVEQGADDMDQTRFDALCEEHSEDLARFGPIFFDVRSKLRTSDLRRWIGLHRLYPEFTEGWDADSALGQVHVVTTKDAESVQTLIEHWGLGIRTKELWTGERGLSKAVAVRRIAEQSGRPATDVLFVDDHPGHLRAVADTGARCFWAAWGYTPEDQAALADGCVRLDRLSDLPMSAGWPVRRV